jgi:hypothetical protein
MLVESKSTLARLMATENLIVEQRQVQTASFDLKNRVLTVPILNGELSPEIYDLLLGHEVGHALETPEEGWHDSIVELKVNRSILNVCEDARIEKKIKQKFPGIRISFVKGYRELMEMDFFGVKDMNVNELNFIDRINLHTKGGVSQGIEFTDEEMELVKEVEQAEKFQETLEVAIKIQAFMKEELKNKKDAITIKIAVSPEENNQVEPKSSAPVDFDFDEISDTENTKGAPKKSDNKDEKEIETGNSTSSTATEETEKTEGEKNQAGNGSAGSDDAEIESKTDKSFRKKQEELYAGDKARDMMYTNIPKILLENAIINYKEVISEIESENGKVEFFNTRKMLSDYNKFKVESNKVVSYLVKEFEMRKNAEQQSRASVSKTGELNMSRIHDYKFTDDIFARMTKVPNGKSHGLVMFVDWSGSMIDHINPTVKQLLNLVMFCKKVNIPFDVYAFSSHGVPKKNKRGYDVYKEVTNPKVGDLIVNPFSLVNILSHKMTANEFTKMSSYLLNFGTGRFGSCSCMIPPHMIELSGTPLNEAIIAAMEVVPKFRTDNRLEIVNTIFLTDGEGQGLGSRINDVDGVGNILSTSSARSTFKMRSFLRDPVTKASVEILDSSGRTYGYYSACETNALLKLLKQRVNSNVIGFYIAKIRDVRHALNLYASEDEHNTLEKRIADFRKNNFTYLNDTGYDEYYFLRSDKIDTDEEEEFEVTKNTTRGLVTAFSKYAGSRISNRIVLNRFINLIA